MRGATGGDTEVPELRAGHGQAWPQLHQTPPAHKETPDTSTAFKAFSRATLRTRHCQSIPRSPGLLPAPQPGLGGGSKGTHTMWARSRGFSGCSGNSGRGGSRLGTQPRDLLMAWLSFLAGDFCEGNNSRSQVSLGKDRVQPERGGELNSRVGKDRTARNTPLGYTIPGKTVQNKF